MNPFSNHYDKGKSSSGQMNLSKSNTEFLKRATERVPTSELASKRAKGMYSDNQLYNDYSHPASSNPSHQKNLQESNLPGLNHYYSQPVQSAGNRYHDHIPSRGTMEENRLREQNEILQSKLSAVLEDYQQLVALRYTEPESSLLEQEKVIEEINKNSVIYSERMDALEKLLEKINGGDTNAPLKDEVKGNYELKLRLKKLQKMYNEVIEKEKKVKQENGVFKELTGLTIKEAKTKEEGVEYIYILTGRNGSLEFSLFIPNQEDEKVAYSPMSEPHQVAKLKVPEFLNDELVFDRNQLNKFFWRVSTVLYEENNEKDEQITT